jgi:hypothetical protein
LACASECQHCASMDIKEHDHGHCAQLDLECAVLCLAVAQLMSLGSAMSKDMCRLCADMCKKCGDECAKHDVEHCRECAAACRHCEEVCRNMAA